MKGQRSRGGRRGNVFSVRIPPEDRIDLEQRCARDAGPKRLGPWLVWKALGGDGLGSTAPAGHCPSTPRLGNAPSAGTTPTGGVVPEPLAGAGSAEDGWPPVGERVVLDLCAGSGSWSEPYRRAGYAVRRVTLPAEDVRTFRLSQVRGDVWGILAAPPCTEFSLAKNGQSRDFAAALAVVDACVRLIFQARPRWWALENPVGLLGRWLGAPSDVFDPCDFGDPWTKRTALWGDFSRPARGPWVTPADGGGPLCSICHPDDPRSCSLAEHRAVTPPGFARAFAEANP